ncbi:hypothetical protein CEE37_01340 [candidate division LCP-89 bacterium B3_LCP]|uniref:Flagellar assembly protein T N-terminal domain-containing protein n=1 Tax=candidate division LCP-89 bacterium B3_LCP TaxID=2012998 RepID=A0A532V573_UNCL8|nr:MAG: hypothetical protein CEE37_01340 [candidate division LCP-89 bacterium B3_LCP]
MKPIISIVTILLLLSAVWAQDSPVETVTVRGEATIYEGDIPAARDEALVDAQRNALEQVMGVQIKSETAIQDFMLADDTILSMISGHVKDSRITSEKQEMEYLVLEVECDVVKELSPEEAQKLMRNFSCVVGFTTEIDGGVVDDNRIGNKLISDLVKADFDVRDISQMLSLEGYQAQFRKAVDNQDIAAARWIGRQLLSNVVIVGKAKLEMKEKKEVTGFAGVVGVYVYDCWLEARAIEAESGQIIAQYASEFEGVQGTGNTPQKAVTMAMTRAERAFSKDLLSQLTEYGGKKSRPITVEVEGIPTYESFQKVKQFLSNVRFRDSEVSDLGFAAGEKSTFRFNYSEKINLIAIKLDHLPNLSVMDRSEVKVICRYSSIQ